MENFDLAVKSRVDIILKAKMFTSRSNPTVSMSSSTQIVLAPLTTSSPSARQRSRSRSQDSYSSRSRSRSRSRESYIKRSRESDRSPGDDREVHINAKRECTVCGRKNHTAERCFLQDHPQANHDEVPWRKSKMGQRLRELQYKVLPFSLGHRCLWAMDRLVQRWPKTSPRRPISSPRFLTIRRTRIERTKTVARLDSSQ